MTKTSHDCKHEILLGLEECIATCLFCKECYYLDKNPGINYKNVINVTGVVDLKYIYAYENGTNILVIRASEKLKELLPNYNLTTNKIEIMANILDDLIYYTDELDYSEKIIRRRSTDNLIQ